MSYPYGTKGAPVVGSGLGGLPRRTVATAAPTPKSPIWLSREFGSHYASSGKSFSAPVGTCARLRIHGISSGAIETGPFEMFIDKTNSKPVYGHAMLNGSYSYGANVTSTYSYFLVDLRYGYTPTFIYSVDYFDNLSCSYSTVSITTTPLEIVFPSDLYSLTLVLKGGNSLGAGQGSTQIRIKLEKGIPSTFVLYYNVNGGISTCYAIFDGTNLYRDSGSGSDLSNLILEQVTYI